MISLEQAVESVLAIQNRSRKPLAVVVAGHNGAGKSSMWYGRLASAFEIPLINADRMMVSILPEGDLPAWATNIRDKNESWMAVAQKGVEAFVKLAIDRQVPFARETVFSHLVEHDGNVIESKVNDIRHMQQKGYYVLLMFVGLANVNLSKLRVLSRFKSGKHNVPPAKLDDRFPRTQRAIRHALTVADASILVDNSRAEKKAFTVCRVQTPDKIIFDCRQLETSPPRIFREWLDIVAPMGEPPTAQP